MHFWPEASPRPLDPGEIHVWSSDLDRSDEELGLLLGCLSVEEKARASRFRFARDRRRYIAGRATLRSILGAYTGEAPPSLEIVADSHGKPALAERRGATARSLRFNVTHSGRLALFAVSHAAEVGIDVEEVQPLPDADTIAEGYFSVAERLELRKLEAVEKPGGFFRCWTRKEAYLKAIGLGLAAPLDAFTVAVAADAQVRFLHFDGDPAAAARWTLYSLDPARGYQGALAVEALGLTIHAARWRTAPSAIS